MSRLDSDCACFKLAMNVTVLVWQFKYQDKQYAVGKYQIEVFPY